MGLAIGAILAGRLARWAIYLQAYEFEIVHRKGSKHTNADALSRPVLAIEGVQERDDEDVSPKNLDPYEDERLLYFTENRRHQPVNSNDRNGLRFTTLKKRLAEKYKV